MPSHQHQLAYIGSNVVGGSGAWVVDVGVSSPVYAPLAAVRPTGGGAAHGHGDTGSASNVPEYYEVYAWRRTA